MGPKKGKSRARVTRAAAKKVIENPPSDCDPSSEEVEADEESTYQSPALLRKSAKESKLELVVV